MNINQFHDGETIRQQRNLTTTQKKNSNYTQEGVIVNNFIKDTGCNLDETCDTLVISDNAKMPEKLSETRPKEKSLIPIAGIAVGVMGVLAGVSGFILHSAKVNLNLDHLKKLPSTIRNVAINEETHQALYQIVQCPNKKTIMAGTGVLVLTAMAFMGKTFFDGFKEVWVKKREADIQKNLQEKLVSIETQSFSGKIQIIRSMMSDKAREFGHYLVHEDEPVLTNFNGKKFNPFFKGNQRSNAERKSNANYFLLGMATVGAIAGLGYFAIRNLTKSKGHLDKLITDIQGEIGNIVKKVNGKPTKEQVSNLKNLFISIEASPEKMGKALKDANWEKFEMEAKDGSFEKVDVKEFIEKISTEIKKSTVDANIYCGGGKTPKPTFYSHVDDYRAFLYNYLLDTDNKQFRALFFGITGLTGIGYGGKLLGDAVKEVQVKKINAETEADLQQRLVSTELRNFKSKKDAAIQPLMDEFYHKAGSGKPKAELKTVADNILFEIKNGPPFVYS